MTPPTTLVELLRARAQSADPSRGYTYLRNGEEVDGELPWAELDRRARGVAAQLQQRLRPGDRALLVYPPGLEFLAAFFGCLYAGVIAVPTMLPGKRAGRERLAGITRDSTPALLLTQDAVLSGPAAPTEALEGAGLPILATDGLANEGDDWREIRPGAEDIAFLQYTSGSTRDPRGVVVTHANILHNQAMMRDAFGQDDRSVIVGWLPFHHDMGLVGTILQPLFVDARCILLPPASVLQQPLRWLQAMSRYGGTTSGGPNFIFDLCVRRIPEEQRTGLDLGAWRVAYNGAEPVRPATMDRFAAAFEACGFRRAAFHPCYGLAEATLMVTSCEPGGRSAAVERSELEQGRAVLAGDGADAQELAGSGRVRGGQAVAVVDPATREELPAGRVGEIWVAGPSVARGYWNGHPGVFGQTLASGGEGRWLRTGDLGFFHDGELFVTGRRKDLIILRGRNLYPQDLEHSAEQAHVALAAGGGAAFARPAPGGEELVLVLELSRAGMKADPTEVAAAVRHRLVEEHDADPAEVVLLAPGGLPRTTSGKVRRAATAQALAAGELAALAREARPGASAAVAEVAPLSAAELSALPPGERVEAVAGWLQGLVAGLVSRPADRLDLHCPLTALGLDSLAAMQLEGALEAQLQRPVPLGELLGELSLAQLAERLVAMPASSPPAAPAGGGGGDTLALSPGQRALWFLHRLEPESTAYHVGVVADLDDDLDLDAFRHAWGELCARHDILRSVIDERDGEPVRRVLPPGDAPLELHDASGWSDDERQDAVRGALREAFALDRDPPLRIRLFHRPGEGHRAALVVHHIAVDFWSLMVLARELGELYTARLQGRPSRLPAPDPASRPAAWTQRQAARLDAHGDDWWRRWQERLGDAPEELALPVEGLRGGPGAETHAVPFALEAPVYQRLRALASQHGTTIYPVLLAGFAALWHRTGGQEEVLVGTPTAGRRHPADRDTVGYLSNLVPLRVDLSGDPSFGELIDRARAMLADALELQEYPFPQLVEKLQPRRVPGRHPLVQAVLALEKPHGLEGQELSGFVLGEAGSRLTLGELVVCSAELPDPAAPFDMTVMLVEAGEVLRGSWRCRADLFAEEGARSLARRFTALLEAAVAEPALPVSRLPLWAGGERRELLEQWSGRATGYPSGQAIHELFVEEARSRPEAVAVVADDTRWSYAELERRSRELAGRLQAAGIAAEGRVGVVLGRGPQVVVALLGVLRAGGAYVPLDPGDPPGRLRLLAEDAGVELLVADAAGQAATAALGLPVVQLDGAGSASAPFTPVAVSPDQLAYILYTSGSTGRPKGVMVPHRAVVRLVRNNPYAQLGPEQTLLHAAPLSFDASTFEIWGALLNGGKLAIYQGNPLSLAELGEALVTHGVTTLWLTAGLFHLMVEERLDDLAPLQQLLAGGDVLRPELVSRAKHAHPQLRLTNGYGPTEATTFSCCHDATASTVVPQPLRVPIGRPLANTRAYVVDGAGEPVPPGVPGELLIGGDGLARGYAGDAALTARRFVPDPFSGVPGARLYRTGDRVCWRPDGRLDFLGRMDNQLKVRGFRVEPGEIEVALSTHAGVASAVVVAQPDRTGKGLVAYYTPASTAPPEPAALREFLAARLPAHLVPSQFVPLESFPLNARGKVDRGALPRPAPATKPASPVAAPADPLVDQVAAVWAEVLGVAAVDVDRNLFELGAHSLAVTRAHARLSRELGREIRIVDMFAHPTIRGFATHLAGPTEDLARQAGEGRAAARRAARQRRGRAMKSTGGGRP